MSPLPKNNPFLKFTPEMAEKVEKNLREDLKLWIGSLCASGSGEVSFVTTRLKYIQKVLEHFQEFGHEVTLLDEKQFPELVEAIGVLKRGGLRNEIREILLGLLEKCNIPKFELLKQ